MSIQRIILAAWLVATALAPAGSARASDALPESVELIPIGDTEFAWGSGRFVGELTVVAVDGRLGLVESQTLDSYLTGLREVPASWPEAALAAQAVAARTFLAWTMERGRTAAGRAFGYDICATQACQVYRGSAVARSPAAAPWVEAVERTSGEVLLFEGRPAHTFYSSSAGSRTRAVQDVWGGGGSPYLVAVDSPEIGVTPYEEWVVELAGPEVVRILAAAGVATAGEITSAAVESPPEGGGRATVTIGSADGLARLTVPQFRAIFNVHGPRLYPGLLPATRPDGRRWPQAVLSYTFDLEWIPQEGAIAPGLATRLPVDDAARSGALRIVGEGWGHGVGMSQWGAKAMSDRGATYEEILGHYYGGLQPQLGSLPEVVRVGLAEGELSIALSADGPFEMRANGIRVGALPAGTWSFRAVSGGIGVVPPEDIAADSGHALLRRKWPR